MAQQNEDRAARKPCFNDCVLQKLKLGATLFGTFRPPSPPLDFSMLQVKVQEATQGLNLNQDEEQRMVNFVKGILGKIPAAAREEQPRDLVQVTQSGLRTVPGPQAAPPESSAKKGIK